MPCIFCKGIHFNDSCDKFVDRKTQLSSQGCCFVCLRLVIHIRNALMLDLNHVIIAIKLNIIIAVFVQNTLVCCLIMIKIKHRLM